MKKLKINENRITSLNDAVPGPGPVVYIMSRDQRVADNWAILYAQKLALDYQKPLMVICPVLAEVSIPTMRQAVFSVEGMKGVEKRLKKLHIPFLALPGGDTGKILSNLKKIEVSIAVTDFSPLREGRSRRERLAFELTVPFYEVDAHNIVPCRIASPKKEYAAYTFRPKIKKLLDDYLTDFPSVLKHPHRIGKKQPVNDWDKIMRSLKIDRSVGAVGAFIPGEDAAAAVMKKFLEKKLPVYNDRRNDPNADAQSDLSPYLHFGQISAQRIAFEAHRYDKNIKSQEAFLEELIVRRELSDNFCFYCEDYDNFDGFPDWARKTLEEHRHDPRPYVYDRQSLEQAETHDELWNAAQLQMVTTGKMHGYMRMYWAKKILEWSFSPEEALAAGIYLNDKYSLDGNDPNGYSGVAWSIGGVHDRPWFERDIFGKIRYMSYRGCKRKFDVGRYVKSIEAMKAGE